MRFFRTTPLILAAAAAASVAVAAPVELRVTVDNLAPANSIAFAPLRVGFNAGTYDSFDDGAMAGAAIISIAEGGSGADWFPAFAAADPTAELGTVVPNPPGPLLPDASATADFTFDSAVNPFFTFGAMVVPSNDYFIGNDAPNAYMLFDAGGNLNFNDITLSASDVWDAGSEVDGVFGAAFLQGSSNDDRTPDDDPVGLDFADLSIFNGLTTAAGYTFQSQLTASTPVYRISFEVIPEPGTALLFGLAAVLGLRRRSSLM